jgi:hypothetical protein
MTPEETAAATADAVGHLASHFMLDPATYTTGAELGFPNMSFYVGGRGGALGDVGAGVVAASFVFFAPDMVATGWEEAREVMSRTAAAEAFIGCGHAWARNHLPDGLELDELAGLAGTVISGANPAGAPLFAAWRDMDEPDDPKALVLHRMNVLRELRGGLHASAVIAGGVSPRDAVAVRTPFMSGLFGWPEPGDVTSVVAAWEDAEVATNRAMGTALSVLDAAGRQRFAELSAGVLAATT